MKLTYVKLLVICIIVGILATSFCIAGIINDSPYDKNWTIVVESCNGSVVTYNNCVLTNMGEYSVSFIPNQGRIPTGNDKEIIINKNSCTTVTMMEK